MVSDGCIHVVHRTSGTQRQFCVRVLRVCAVPVNLDEHFTVHTCTIRTHLHGTCVQVCVPGTGVRTVQCTPGTRTTRTRTRTAVLLPGT